MVVEGPLAHNTLYLQLLQGLLPLCICRASLDNVEGTARGAWLLSRWGASQSRAMPAAVPETLPAALQAKLARYHQAWLGALACD